MENCISIRSVQMGPIPTELDVPSLTVLRQLQGYSGEFNWLVARTRPDISYHTSVLASACSKFAIWSLELAKKILRFLKGTKSKGLIITSSGDEGQLDVWTDAGYAGTNTHSQSGLVVTWAGSIVVWRSSRQSFSAFSTA